MTWRRATAAGSRIAVRLIAAVQASSRRTWSSIARARRRREVEPRAARPRSRASRVRGREGREVLDARRERLSRAVHGTPPVAAYRSRAAPLPASSHVAPRAGLGLPPVHPVRGRVSPSPSRTALPAVTPVRMPDGTGHSRGDQPYPRTPGRAGRFVDKSTRRRRQRRGQPRASARDRSWRPRDQDGRRRSLRGPHRGEGLEPVRLDETGLGDRGRRAPSASSRRGPAGRGRTPSPVPGTAATSRSPPIAPGEVAGDRQAEAGAGDPASWAAMR